MFMPPEWVMFGMTTENGVTLIASSHLTLVELEANIDEYELGYWSPAARQESYSFKVQMPNYVMVVAPTYAEALRKLSEQDDWRPKNDVNFEPKEITA